MYLFIHLPMFSFGRELPTFLSLKVDINEKCLNYLILNLYLLSNICSAGYKKVTYWLCDPCVYSVGILF